MYSTNYLRLYFKIGQAGIKMIFDSYLHMKELHQQVEQCQCR